jgi:hypothetical protein
VPLLERRDAIRRCIEHRLLAIEHATQFGRRLVRFGDVLVHRDEAAERIATGQALHRHPGPESRAVLAHHPIVIGKGLAALQC